MNFYDSLWTRERIKLISKQSILNHKIIIFAKLREKKFCKQN